MTTTVEPTTDNATSDAGRGRGRKPRLDRVAASTARSAVVGLAPGVDLLPKEVHAERRERRAVRRAWLGVVGVAAVVAVGIGAATATALHAGADLRSAEAETTALLGQQGQYAEVRGVESDSALLDAAQKVGGSTEIDWSTYLHSVQASLPSTVTITSVTVDSSSPIADFTQATGPLQGQRVATVSVVASSPTLPSVPDWLDSVRSLRGYVDASASSVTLADDAAGTGGYTVNMTIHVNQDAYDGRYADEEK